MTVLIKLFYAVCISCLLVLLLAFGVRTVYTAPVAPDYPDPPPAFRGPGPVSPVPAEVTEYNTQMQKYQEEYERYSARRANYRRDVLVAVAALGIAAVAGGLALPKAFDAIRLGLVLGGLATVLYGVAQAGEDLDQAGPTLMFAVSAVGLALILYVGYRWLAGLEQSQADG